MIPDEFIPLHYELDGVFHEVDHRTMDFTFINSRVDPVTDLY